ncbi:hypothetical protein AHAS_Ahas02G0218400 [Arachis hypogaea]
MLQDGFDWHTGRISQSFWYHAWRASRMLTHLVPFVHVSDSILNLEDVWHHEQWWWDIICTMIPKEIKLDLIFFILSSRQEIKQVGFGQTQILSPTRQKADISGY